MWVGKKRNDLWSSCGHIIFVSNLILLLLTTVQASPQSDDGSISFHPQHGFMMVTPPTPHYIHDPLHGVDLMAQQSRIADELRKDNPPLLPPEVDMSLAGQMQQLHNEMPLEPRSVPNDPMARQLFGSDSQHRTSSISQPKCQTICDYEVSSCLSIFQFLLTLIHDHCFLVNIPIS